MPLALKLKIQSALSFLLYFFIATPIAVLIFIFNYTKVYHKERMKGLKLPFISVSNHLSLIDSWFINWAIGFPQVYWNNRIMPWQVAEATNYFRGLLGIFVWLSRTIPIKRGSTPIEQALSMKKGLEVLKMGEAVHIFPEGTRSRTGRMGNYTTGIGRIYKQVPNCTILPIYIRGMENVLPIGVGFPRFFKKVDVVIGQPVKVEYEGTGIKANKEISEKIFNILVQMEKDYFASDQYRSKEIMAEKEGIRL